ncbi:UTRA domain-containing protein [Streptomyces sp. NPDC102278]|uniref:UTRA domain-containing protein n=1 Tax=Streptomyces sp. NPDC102278 TaxID=3366152 RepID=UPI00380886E1
MGPSRERGNVCEEGRSRVSGLLRGSGPQVPATGGCPVFLPSSCRPGTLSTAVRRRSTCGRRDRESKPSVERSYRDLVERGLVVRKPRVGTVVRSRGRVRVPLASKALCCGLVAIWVRGRQRWPAAGVGVSAGVGGSVVSLALERIAAPADIAALLGLEPGMLVVRRGRHALIDGDVVQVQEAFYPVDVVEACGLDQPGKLVGGVLGAMTSDGPVPGFAGEKVTVRMPTTAEAAEFGMGEGVPVLCVERVVRGRGGRVLDALRVVGAAGPWQGVWRSRLGKGRRSPVAGRRSSSPRRAGAQVPRSVRRSAGSGRPGPGRCTAVPTPGRPRRQRSSAGGTHPTSGHTSRIPGRCHPVIDGPQRRAGMRSGPSPASASGRRQARYSPARPSPSRSSQVLDSQIERFSTVAKATHAA